VAARIVVTRRIPEPAIELLQEAGDVWVSPHDRPLATDELHAAVAGADGVVTLLHDRVDDAFLDAAGSGLRIVANAAVGYDNVDVPACARRGVVVSNTPGVLTEATADIAFALILMATRRLGEGERLIRARTPWSWSMFFMLGSGIQGKTLGIVGLGKIGLATARRARVFGMEIAYAGRRRAPADVETELAARFLPLDELLAQADVVSLHCPLSAETRHLIDAEALGRMQPSAFLVNTTRGPVVDEAALADALRTGTIAGAGLDVFEQEPLPADHPLWTLPGVLITPHTAGFGPYLDDRRFDILLDNCRRFLKGQPLRNVVDKPRWF
jgi:lactate dehydrogenase-like 2-hydroxyacid dehydrogenase